MAIPIKGDENFITPRKAQWQPNQKQDLPLMNVVPSGVNYTILDGNNFIGITSTTQTYCAVIPGTSLTVPSNNAGNPVPGTPQTVGNFSIRNTKGSDLTIRYYKASGVQVSGSPLIATLPNNQVLEGTYFGDIDKYYVFGPFGLST